MKTAVLSLRNVSHPSAVLGKLVAPGSGAAARLYRARRDLVMSLDPLRWPAWVWLDGDDDELGPALEPLLRDGLPPGVAIAYGDEDRGDESVRAKPWTMAAWLADPLMIHHGAVCSTRATQAITWPDGCHWFEGVVYPALAAVSHLILPGVAYRWKPTPGGAGTWPDHARATVNSLRLAQGLDGVHLPSDFEH